MLIVASTLNLFVCVCARLSLSQVSIYEGDKRDCRKFCTTGIDGAMTIWDFKVNTHAISLLQSCTSPDISAQTLLCVLCLSPQSLEASIQGLRIMWRNLVKEWRDAAASPLTPCHLCPSPSSLFTSPPSAPATQPVTHTHTHLTTLLSVCWSTDQTITHYCGRVLTHSHTRTLKYTDTHALHRHTHWADVWHYCWFIFSFVFNWRLTRCQSGKVFWHVLKRDVKCVFLCSLTSCTKSWTLKGVFYPKIRLYFTSD